MDWIFAGQQAVAENTARAPQHNSPAVSQSITDQKIVNIVRVIELELAVAIRSSEAENISKLIGIPLQSFWRVDRK
jgi:hypothetical protein